MLYFFVTEGDIETSRRVQYVLVFNLVVALPYFFLLLLRMKM